MAARGSDVDLRGLAIDRGSGDQAGTTLRVRSHLLTRYVLPIGLIAGFLVLVAWSARDWVFPPRHVTVVPVLATRAEMREAGTPLFKAAGQLSYPGDGFLGYNVGESVFTSLQGIRRCSSR